MRSQDLGLIPSDSFRLDLGRHRPRSWLCFALANPSAVERENRGAACRRRIGVDDYMMVDDKIRGEQALDQRLSAGTHDRHQMGSR